jgi:hypothetical protein
VEDNNNSDNEPRGRKRTLPYTLACTGKVQVGPSADPNDQEGGKGRERCLLLAQAGLSSYLCRLCTMCVSLSRLGVVSTPLQYDGRLTPRYDVPVSGSSLVACSINTLPSLLLFASLTIASLGRFSPESQATNI